MEPVTIGDCTLYRGDCRDILPDIPDGTVDAVICDPPYPCIKRSYGYWTETEWFALMDPVVEQCRRVLKPTGSAVFILQPNSERVGRMRTWLLQFILKWAEEWGWVQDAYWWNIAALPNVHAIQGELLRPSIKACVWFGSPNCYRNQDAVLWSEAELTYADRQRQRCGHVKGKSRVNVKRERMAVAVEARGGVLPFNVVVCGGGANLGKNSHKHPARTPSPLARWWARYICPPGGVVLDPFAGSGTISLAALKEGRKAVGIERVPEYFDIAVKRLESECAAAPLFGEGAT